MVALDAISVRADFDAAISKLALTITCQTEISICITFKALPTIAKRFATVYLKIFAVLLDRFYIWLIALQTSTWRMKLNASVVKNTFCSLRFIKVVRIAWKTFFVIKSLATGLSLTNTVFQFVFDPFTSFTCRIFMV